MSIGNPEGFAHSVHAAVSTFRERGDGLAGNVKEGCGHGIMLLPATCETLDGGETPAREFCRGAGECIAAASPLPGTSPR